MTAICKVIQKFLIYKEIQNGMGAKLYTRKGFLKHEDKFANV
jgi:hypothetical protein